MISCYPNNLHQAGFRLHQTALYMARAKTKFSSQTIQLLQAGALHSVLLFSPRSAKDFAKLFCKLLENMPQSSAKDGMTIGVLSPAIAKAFITPPPYFGKISIDYGAKTRSRCVNRRVRKTLCPKIWLGTIWVNVILLCVRNVRVSVNSK